MAGIRDNVRDRVKKIAERIRRGRRREQIFRRELKLLRR